MARVSMPMMSPGPKSATERVMGAVSSPPDSLVPRTVSGTVTRTRARTLWSRSAF
jgi:hypothetical protein